jgi:7,8-dihydropterin-6-yl-methyl-4-(beta-D-ribofuranosyl)aminobenzene 5'-phosphate synthase
MTVVYNHVVGGTDIDLEPQGGFAVVVRFRQHTILFDTGGERSVLTSNMRELGFDPFALDAIVISHNHWDHVYGLAGLSSMTQENPPVYVPPTALEGLRQQNPRARLVAVDKPVEALPGVWVVGPMDLDFRGMPFTEQALVLEQDGAVTILVGCSHPGVTRIVKEVKRQFGDKRVTLMAGGFHLRRSSEAEIQEIAESLKTLDVASLAPSHCTGDEAAQVLRRTWGDNIVPFQLGDIIRF